MAARSASLNSALRTESLARIHSAALQVFSEFGFHGTTMRQIAEKSGLSNGLLYHYYPTKADIFGHLVDHALESSIAGMEMVLSQPIPAWSRLEAFSGVLVANAFSGESARYFLIILQAMTQASSVPGLQARVQERTDRYFEVLAPVIAEAQADGLAGPGDPRTLAAAFFAFLQGLSLFVFHGKGFERQITPALLLSAIRKGVG